MFSSEFSLSSSLRPLLNHTLKGNFPLAECNELSGKCFSHTPLGAWV